MAIYEFAKVSADSKGVYLWCTTQSELNTVYSELQKAFPKCTVKKSKVFPPGQTYYCHVHHLSGHDIDALWWVIKFLCAHGWEPLGITSISSGGNYISSDLQYLFRRGNST